MPRSSVQWAMLPRASGGGLQPSLLGKQSQAKSLQLILLVPGIWRERPWRKQRQRKRKAMALPSVLLGHTDRLHPFSVRLEWMLPI